MESIPDTFLAAAGIGSTFSSFWLAGLGLVGFVVYREWQERARTRASLQQTQQRYHAILERSGDSIIIARASDLAIIEANPAARRMIGLDEGSFPRLTEVCQMALGDDDVAPEDAYEWFVLIEKRRRLSLVRKDGSALAVETDALQIEHDGALAYQFFFREVTDRTLLEQQLLQAQKLASVGQMVCSVAHELCNPLAVVNGYAEILLERNDIDESVRAQLVKVRYEANRASKLVKTFLTYSRRKPVCRQPTNLNDAINQALEVSALELRDASAETILHLERDLPQAIADSDQVQQILVNLIHNSLQAIAQANRAPRLTFTTIALDEKVVLKIEDNGPGIPRNIVSKIFEPFFTTKPAGVGTGLGLSIAHTIMAEHKGRIYYISSATGGAGFVLEFPRAGREALLVEPETPQKPVEKSTPARARILILDDQETIADLLSEMIRLLGHEPISENDPQRALERLEEETFDVILTDYRMPDMNGQEFYNAAIAVRPEISERVIFLTGDLMNQETHQFLTGSGLPYVRKPFHLAKLEKAIATVLVHDSITAAN